MNQIFADIGREWNDEVEPMNDETFEGFLFYLIHHSYVELLPKI